jgi:hypothetical protein
MQKMPQSIFPSIMTTKGWKVSHDQLHSCKHLNIIPVLTIIPVVGADGLHIGSVQMR